MRIIFKEANAITIELINNDCYYTEPYDIYLNGKYYASKITNVFSLYDLAPNTEYNVLINGKTIEFKTLDKKIITLKKNKDIVDDTEYINEAIKNLKANEILSLEGHFNITSIEIFDNNKSIYFSPRSTILCETKREKYKIFESTDIKNNIVLGTWEGRSDRAFYSPITVVGAKNVNLYGPGLIDCNACNSDWWINHREMRIARRPKGIFIHTSDNVFVEGINLKNTPSWSIHPFYSSNINIINTRVENPMDSPTTDGCDPEACLNVNIIGNYFSVGDDCIAIKSSKIELASLYHRPSSNIIIRNNIMAHGHAGVTLGSENSGGINNVYVSQCYFNETDRGLRVKSQRGRGKDAIISNISFDNIHMNSVKTPFVINAFYKAGNDVIDSRFDEFIHKVDDTTPSFDTFKFKNIKCDNVSYGLGFFKGLPESHIKNVVLENVWVTYNKNSLEGIMAMTPNPIKYKGVGFVLSNIDKLELINVKFIDAPLTMYIKDDNVKISEE